MHFNYLTNKQKKYLIAFNSSLSLVLCFLCDLQQLCRVSQELAAKKMATSVIHLTIECVHLPGQPLHSVLWI